MSDDALLRSPPFPGPTDASVSRPKIGVVADALEEPVSLFAQIREARVGGRFWAAPAPLSSSAGIVVRPRLPADITEKIEAMSTAERKSSLWSSPPGDNSLNRKFGQLIAAEGGAWCGDVNPWSALKGAECLLAHGDDEWVALARIAGLPVRLLSDGRFGAAGDDGPALDRRAARCLTEVAYRDPFTGEPATVDATVGLLNEWRMILEANRQIVAACGIAWWKRPEIRRFLWSPQRRLHFTQRQAKALSLARKTEGKVAIWPSRVSSAFVETADRQNVPLLRVEDGFVRSVGLGSDLVPPSSVVVDASGIHYDPTGPSDLEQILSMAEFSPALLGRARRLLATIVAAGVSKYTAGLGAPVPERRAGSKLILVPGQVEDDMSVLRGGGGLTSNLDLIRRTRALEPEAEIWFRPHPDVEAGHRKGAIADSDVLLLADRIVRGSNMAGLLDKVDAVHVLTSLTGFEALLRGREVTCHGTPFYAGWGLTLDLGEVPTRRGRRLTIDELVAGVLILYPRYLDPVTGLPCPPEVLIARMTVDEAPSRQRWIVPLRRWQGRLMARLR